MKNNLITGIDCGATKIMVQTSKYDEKSNKIVPIMNFKECFYSEHPKWNNDFKPISIDIQKSEHINGNISITKEEKLQGDVIVDMIQKVTSSISNKKIGLCFPGIKNENGILVMANGPRIPDLKNRIFDIEHIYDDSECCILGEWKSSIGQIQDEKNCIYIGGGTGIADGVILDGEILDFNDSSLDLKRSWEINTSNERTVESCLSPGGILKYYNKRNKTTIKTLSELSKKNDFTKVMSIASDAFLKLIDTRIKYFFMKNHTIDKIIIGQRLGHFLKNSDRNLMRYFIKQTSIPIVLSYNRTIASLGIAWKLLCS